MADQNQTGGAVKERVRAKAKSRLTFAKNGSNVLPAVPPADAWAGKTTGLAEVFAFACAHVDAGCSRQQGAPSPTSNLRECAAARIRLAESPVDLATAFILWPARSGRSELRTVNNQ